MRVIGIIPARYASTRFPGKPLIDIKGKTMIQRVYESCIRSKLLDQVIVATDDDRIYKHLKEIGADVEMTDVSHMNGTERIAEVVARNKDFDIAINIQGDEPCIQSEQIEELILLMKHNSKAEIGTLAQPLENKKLYEKANAVKVHFENDLAVNFTRITEAKEAAFIGKHVGIYAFRTDVLLELVKLEPTESEISLSLEQMRWMDNGYKIGVTWTDYESPSVDAPDDLIKVELLMEKNGWV